MRRREEWRVIKHTMATAKAAILLDQPNLNCILRSEMCGKTGALCIVEKLGGDKCQPEGNEHSFASSTLSKQIRQTRREWDQTPI